MRILLAALTMVGVATTAAAQDAAKSDLPSITVRGEASAKVVPDTVVAVFGVVTRRPSASDAVATNNQATADAIAAMKAEGIAATDIATINAGLMPEMSPPDKGAPKIVGYRAENQLQVRFRPADRAGPILGRLVDKGVNDIESVTSVTSDDAALRDRLRAEAAKDARRQADIYAGALGLKLGMVTKIDPEGTGGEEPVALPRRFAAAAAPVPIEVGQKTVSASVQVTFTLQPQEP